ncbi:conserved exported hypothetical protein [Cupriavidus necator]|uniref:DUF2061 domain-containing protein n=1 Tax=Cupriavidus necator TaxID=106590 RepID=A0A1K0IRG2_CUPNE|nr:conserved exported hypothetical protein [Cupriavidus necator]
MSKTLTFGIMHLGIAFSVTYALTASLAISGAITFEPAVNTMAHYFFDRYWEKREQRQAGAARGHAPAQRANMPIWPALSRSRPQTR